MSLSGLFLILFLLVHLAGNLQLLAHDNGHSFNVYAHFMTQNPLIKTISYVLYATILLHTVQGILLYSENRKAKGSKYQVKSDAKISSFSRYMVHLGVVIFAFLLIHLYQFWLKMKLGQLPIVQYPGSEKSYQDLNYAVVESYKDPINVIFYILCMCIVGMHLWHGFQSAFQTIGIHHKKYNGVIQFVGKAYSLAVAVGFALIPIILYLRQA